MWSNSSSSIFFLFSKKEVSKSTWKNRERKRNGYMSAERICSIIKMVEDYFVFEVVLAVVLVAVVVAVFMLFGKSASKSSIDLNPI
jgi:hypothetical protein